MNRPIDIDGGAYTSASDEFYDSNHGVIDAMNTLTSAIYGCGGMAGTDTGGEAWAAQYDPAAAEAVQAGCDLGQSLATMANLLNISLVNHEGADGGAMLYGPPGMSQSDGDPNPNHWTEDLYAPAPPSARGGIGGEPGWWHWIAGHIEGLLWPDADTGKLRTAGRAWNQAGDAIDAYHYDVDNAAAMVSTQTSPEVRDAVAACQEISQHVRDLATAYHQIGKACTDYAQAVDDHHQEIEDELTSFIEWTIVIEAGSAVLSEIGGELWGQGIEAAEVSNASSKVVRILRDLIEVARTVATTIGEALSRVTQIVAKLGKFLNPKIEQALVKLGLKEAEENLPQWAADAKQLQKKFKHAKDFGITGNYNPANALKFEQKLKEFLDAPGTTRIVGEYHGQPAILSFDAKTAQVVVQDTTGKFISGWGNLTKGQLQHLLTDGKLGGG